MNCDHLSTLTYELTSADKKDFNRRLDEVLSSGEHLFGRSFLTPSIRGHRARSMLATTKSSLPTTSTNGKLVDSETETAAINSHEKRRSSTKHRQRKPLVTPASFSNCEQCGAIVFKVSHLCRNLQFICLRYLPFF